LTPEREIYGEPDLCKLASAYLFGIAKNPFVDGNKRTAFAAADLFLYFNGLSIEAEQADIIQLVMMVAAGEIDEAGAAAFFRDHVVKVEA
ncbi:MAG: type II toxin-antitoxin system death-on-curing family toxin, partial [Mesorhizobium sp.]|uniref:type II toxin-antitoxin system death-on-curing family toxin n=1 Tax=Mesorhizobium sp. TaxID=1871066 RepID=UPI000FE6517B